MRMRCWLLALVAPALLGGCGAAPPTVRIDNARVARLPLEARRPIIDAQRRVDVAQANVGAARVARVDALRLRGAVDDELEAVVVPRHAEALDLTERRMLASRAKRDYADRLVELRDAQLDERQAALALARADLDGVKLDALERHNLAAGLNPYAFAHAQKQARIDLAARRMRVAELQGEVASARTTWDERRRDFNTAAREHGSLLPAR
jgi:hypothetical protein